MTLTRPRAVARRGLAAAALVAAGLLAGACGDDDAEGQTHAAVEDGAVHDGELTLRAIDYAFAGVPDSVPVGTALRLVNEADDEVHEAVVFRLDGAESRSVGELVADPAFDPAALEFVGVAVALPGEAGIEPEGAVIFDRPGRYAVVCFVPTGADAAAYAKALEAGEPPTDAGGAEPHFVHGMTAEIVVR